MTQKQQVDLDNYQKPLRHLSDTMEAALRPGGGLHPILHAVSRDGRLRLDIRDSRFNVYFGGGSLMLVDGRWSPWELRFDEKYFKGGALTPPSLPRKYSAFTDASAWVQAFPDLMHAMTDWWARNPKIERRHCQAMAAANSATAGPPTADYLVLDLEYQWAQRRFDMVAAKRRPSVEDATGWAEPDVVLVEVKSDYRMCVGKSGLGDHARDYRDLITSSNGRHVQKLKLEYEIVVAQKVRLGLLNASLGFRRFSPSVPEMLMVFVDLDTNARSLEAPLDEIRSVSHDLGNAARIRMMRLDSPNYEMIADPAV